MKIKLKSLLFIHVTAHLLELLHDAASLTSRDREWGRGAAVIISMPHIWGSWLRPWGFWHRGLLEDDRHTQKDWELIREKRKEMSTPTCLVTCTLLTGGASIPAHLRRSFSLSVEFLIRSISSCCFSNSCLSFLAALLASWSRLISAWENEQWERTLLSSKS